MVGAVAPGLLAPPWAPCLPSAPPQGPGAGGEAQQWEQRDSDSTRRAQLQGQHSLGFMMASLVFQNLFHFA